MHGFDGGVNPVRTTPGTTCGTSGQAGGDADTDPAAGTKGWRLPEGVVVVARPTRWGNPHRIGRGVVTRAEAVARFERELLASRLACTVDDVRRELARPRLLVPRGRTLPRRRPAARRTNPARSVACRARDRRRPRPLADARLRAPVAGTHLLDRLRGGVDVEIEVRAVDLRPRSRRPTPHRARPTPRRRRAHPAADRPARRHLRHDPRRPRRP